MGRDKALLIVDGQPLAWRVADVLTVAGANPVIAVGGDLVGLRAAGLTAIADPHQGDGPLGGIATALRHLADEDVVVVVACDLPALTPQGIRAVVDALGDADVAVARDGDRLQPLHGAWRPRALPTIERVLAEGRRAVAAALDVLDVVPVDGLDPAWFANVNTPGDVIGHVLGHTGGMSDVPEIDVAELARLRQGGAYVLDVRQPDEYAAAHVPGAVLVPLDQLEARQAEIPRDQRLLVICKSGARSAAAVRALTAAGYDAINVAGGTMAWIEAGHDVAEGPAAG